MMTSQQVVDYVYERIRSGDPLKLSKICEEIFDKCIAPDVATSGGLGCDNMTCMIVQFKKQ